MKLSVKSNKFKIGAILFLTIFAFSCAKVDNNVTVLSEEDAQYQEFSFTAEGQTKQWLTVRLNQGKRTLIDWTNINLFAIKEEAVEAAELDPASVEAMAAKYIEEDSSIKKISHEKASEYTIFDTEEEYNLAKTAGFTGFAFIKEFADSEGIDEFRIVLNRFKHLNSDEVLTLLKKEEKLKNDGKLGEYSLSYLNANTITLSFFQLWNSTGINGFLQSAQAKNLAAKIEIAEYNDFVASNTEAVAETATFGGWGNLFMIAIGFVLLFLAIAKNFEPLLLVPIGIGAILANVPFAGIAGPDGFIGMLYNMGVANGLFPLLIFMGVGAMTDFGPLIANPKTFILGAAAQIGIFGALLIAVVLGDLITVAGAPLFNLYDAASIGIIGGADGPTAIFVTSKLSPDLLGAIAVAAYSYMALVPIIQPPIMKALTSKKERQIKMVQLREVSNREKILFPLGVIFVTALLLPSAIPLLGALMFGNLAKVCGVTDRLSDTMENALINIVTIFLGLSVGSKMQAEMFLKVQTLAILGLGLVAFSMGTTSGVIFAKIMNRFSKEPINPLIGAAGVSAVPMAARVVSRVGQEENPQNFLLMHAMGPNVAGVIGSAVAAGILLNLVPFIAG